MCTLAWELTTAVRRGNLAPQGSVIKSTSIDPTVVDPDGVYRKTGPARVFTTERAAIAAIKSGSIRPNDVIVLICRGPMGAGAITSRHMPSTCTVSSTG